MKLRHCRNLFHLLRHHLCLLPCSLWPVFCLRFCGCFCSIFQQNWKLGWELLRPVSHGDGKKRKAKWSMERTAMASSEHRKRILWEGQIGPLMVMG